MEQKPEDAVSAAARERKGPLPLTEQNLSAMNQNSSSTRGWNIVSTKDGQVAKPRSASREAREVSPGNASSKPKQLKFRNTAIDMKKVHEKKEKDRLLALGWNQPEQMDPTEIKRRQDEVSERSSQDPTRKMASKVFEIVQRNQIVKVPVPPVPRLVLGNHGKQV